MTDIDEFEHDNDGSPYAALADIDQWALRNALGRLHLLGDDPFLRMQAFNLSIVDLFITELEYNVRAKWIDEERAPVPELSFLSAQSQMWIFAAYELMRTWRQRAKDMIKWHENGGLELKLAALEKERGFRHFGRQIRADQIRGVLAEPERVEALRRDLKRTHMLFGQLEAIRVSLAKHEVWQKKGSVASDPGYGRMNRWCGSLDYEREIEGHSMGLINRRDIAEGIRAFPADDTLPSDEDIASFDVFMRGPPVSALQSD